MVKYDEKVSTYWPEFAQNGKENMTVETLLKHEAGFFKLPVQIPVDDIQTKNIK